MKHLTVVTFTISTTLLLLSSSIQSASTNRENSFSTIQDPVQEIGKQNELILNYFLGKYSKSQTSNHLTSNEIQQLIESHQNCGNTPKDQFLESPSTTCDLAQIPQFHNLSQACPHILYLIDNPACSSRPVTAEQGVLNISSSDRRSTSTQREDDTPVPKFLKQEDGSLVELKKKPTTAEGQLPFTFTY